MSESYRPYSLVDSHCHLNYPEIYPHLDEILEEGENHKVGTYLTINTKLSEALEVQAIADAYSQVFCTVGIHPHEAQHYIQDTLYQELYKLSEHKKTVAFGETGLDYYYQNSTRTEQIESFEAHLKASQSTKLPVVIHTRDAEEDTLSVLDRYSTSGVFHCFTGSLDFAKKALDRGLYLSFSGIITFKNAADLCKVVQYVPLDRMLIETDAPFLSPVPHRGKPNQPAWVYWVGKKVAELKEIEFEQVAHQTTQNFFDLFYKAKDYMNGVK